MALDVDDLEQALALVDRIPAVSQWKVGPHLFTVTGPAIVTALKQRGKRVFLDLKLHDIPSVVAHACGTVAGYGVDLLTLHASGGSLMLRESAQAVAGSQCRLLAVTLLTSLDPEQVRQELHISESVTDYALHLAQMAQRSGIHGAVCSGQEVTQLRAACGPDFVLVTPGIREHGADSSPDPSDNPSRVQSRDQSRVLTPAQAIQMGSDLLVVGRPITQAEDPNAAFARICQQVVAAQSHTRP